MFAIESQAVISEVLLIYTDAIFGMIPVMTLLSWMRRLHGSANDEQHSAPRRCGLFVTSSAVA